ncbi:hypothetical protein, partial [Amycolatopsis sp. NPDC003731]
AGSPRAGVPAGQDPVGSSRGSVSAGQDAAGSSWVGVSAGQDPVGSSWVGVSAGQDAAGSSWVGVSAGQDPVGSSWVGVSAGQDAAGSSWVGVSAGQDPVGSSRGSVSAGQDAAGSPRAGVPAGQDPVGSSRGSVSAGQDAAGSSWVGVSAGRDAAGSSRATVHALPHRGRRTPARRLFRYAAAVVAAALVAVTWVVTASGGDPGRVVAEAPLSRQPAAPAGAGGQVQVVDDGSGTVRLKVRLTGMPAAEGLYEVWLYDGVNTMIPLGVTAGADLEVAVPPGLSLSRFPVIDVSAQALGQQEHGTSMLRGSVRA